MFGAYLLVAGFIGFVLWQSLFSPKEIWQNSNASTEKSDQQNHDKRANGIDASPSDKNSTDEIIANYTKWLAIFTALLVAATISLFVSGERNVDVARQSAQAAKDAAVAARRSAEISERALIVTQRAYVRVINYPWVWRSDTDRAGKYFYDITPTVENFGNTPTVNAKINVNSALRDLPLPEGFDFSYQGDAGDTLVGPKQTIGASRAVILDDDLLAIQEGKKFLYIWGTITYRDVFENTPVRTTEFCTEIIRVLGDPLDPRDANAPKGTTVEITFRIYPKHQRTD